MKRPDRFPFGFLGRKFEAETAEGPPCLKYRPGLLDELDDQKKKIKKWWRSKRRVDKKLRVAK